MSIVDRLSNIEKALENYREYKTSIEDLETDVMYLKEKINGLETEINVVRALVSRAYHPNKPHKCPVCEGSGGVKHPLTGLIEPAKCHGCEGKGIVWG